MTANSSGSALAYANASRDWDSCDIICPMTDFAAFVDNPASLRRGEMQRVKIDKDSAASSRVFASLDSKNGKIVFQTLRISPSEPAGSLEEYTSVIRPMTCNHDGNNATSVFRGGEFNTAFSSSELDVSTLRVAVGSSGIERRSERTR